MSSRVGQFRSGILLLLALIALAGSGEPIQSDPGPAGSDPGNDHENQKAESDPLSPMSLLRGELKGNHALKFIVIVKSDPEE